MSLVFKQRIPRYSKELRRMAQFLDTRYPAKPKINVYVYDVPILTDEILDQYDSDTTSAEYEDYFGVYIPEFGDILLAVGGIDSTLACAIFAHEYRHVHQHLADKQFREGTADSFAIHCILAIQTNENYIRPL